MFLKPDRFETAFLWKYFEENPVHEFMFTHNPVFHINNKNNINNVFTKPAKKKKKLITKPALLPPSASSQRTNITLSYIFFVFSNSHKFGPY